MLNDPLYLSPVKSGGGVFITLDPSSDTYRLSDMTDGKSTRIVKTSDGLSTLTINHSDSKENKGIITKRTSVRLDLTRARDDGSTVTSQVTVTASLPSDVLCADDPMWLFRKLVGLLVRETESNDTGAGDNVGLGNFSVFQRVINGEP